MSEIQVRAGSALNETLLRNARKSLNEVAEITGLPVQEVAERYSRLFEERSWRTERQEERLLLIELDTLIQGAQNELARAKDTAEYSSMFKGILSAMKLVADRFDARRRIVDDDLNRITTVQARIWGQAIQLAFVKMKYELAKLYPELDEIVVDEVFEDALPLATRELEAHVG